jgi:hypothetical protein
MGEAHVKMSVSVTGSAPPFDISKDFPLVQVRDSQKFKDVRARNARLQCSSSTSMKEKKSRVVMIGSKIHSDTVASMKKKRENVRSRIHTGWAWCWARMAFFATKGEKT